ncbi:MAG TPA: DUF2783 domain-containing protein [Casimicrobiaceae bacterium]|nr:DUF2783 domain-containing protein [Casimicrobiaceae bacterium]
MPLNIEPNIASPDDFYEALLDAHRDLTRDESDALNARLILLLANHVGDIDVLREALAEARTSSGKPIADSAQRHSTLLKRHP